MVTWPCPTIAENRRGRSVVAAILLLDVNIRMMSYPRVRMDSIFLCAVMPPVLHKLGRISKFKSHPAPHKGI